MSTPAYPIEVAFPDISRHERSGTGIPYMHTFDSDVPGAHVMINALTHGNEVCGAIVVDALLRAKLRPRRGRLTLAFANVAAYRRFDEAKPDAARFVDEDFNRVWTRAVLGNTSRSSCELERAREIRPVIDSVDLLLDLHSMHEKSVPLIVAGPLDKRYRTVVETRRARHRNMRRGPPRRPPHARLRSVRRPGQPDESPVRLGRIERRYALRSKTAQCS